jgi:hypothetical protein
MASNPEQSSTGPVTATARKLKEANSSRMAHLISAATYPSAQDRTTVNLHSQKGFASDADFYRGLMISRNTVGSEGPKK